MVKVSMAMFDYHGQVALDAGLDILLVHALWGYRCLLYQPSSFDHMVTGSIRCHSGSPVVASPRNKPYPKTRYCWGAMTGEWHGKGSNMASLNITGSKTRQKDHFWNIISHLLLTTAQRTQDPWHLRPLKATKGTKGHLRPLKAT